MPGILRAARQRGSMLIVAMGVLTLITLLAVTFGLLMNLEKRAANAYVDRVRARVLAQAGIDTVIGQIKEQVLYRVYSDPRSRLNYNPGRDGAPRYDVPLEEVDPTLSSLAHHLGGSHTDGIDRFITKVVPANAMINVNDHHPSLPVIIESLGFVIAHLRNVENPLPVGTGVKLFGDPRREIRGVRDLEYGGRFESKLQFREALRKHVSEHSYDLVGDYLTTHSWVDQTAVMPSRDTITNPSAAIARGKVQFVRPEDSVALQSETVRFGGRSPIDVNQAPLEVLAAVIMPVGGRRAYHPIPNMPAPLPIDQGQEATGKGNLTGFLEEMDFQNLYFRKINQGQWRPYQWVYFPPYWKQVQGVERAIALARMIIRERNGETRLANREQGPFKCVLDFERWVDALPNNDRIFCSTREAVIPTQGRLAQWGPITTHPDFERFHYESVKSIIKANFNPNGLIGAFNPSSGAWRPVDKGNLLFPKDEELMKIDTAAGGQASSVGDFLPCQTVDFCYGPVGGIYEITSLGQVTGAEDPDLPEGRNRELFGVAKHRTIVQIMGVIRHTTQRDFEENDNLYHSRNGRRRFVRSYPENDIFWPPGDGSGLQSPGHGGSACEEYGRLELDTSLSRTPEQRSKPNITVGSGGSARPQPLFEALWDKRERAAIRGRFRLADALRPIWAGGRKDSLSPLSSPYGSVVYRDHDSMQGIATNFVLSGGAQLPDGVWSSLSAEGKGITGDARTIWFRAADPGVMEPVSQGRSQKDGEVNVQAFKGTIEFWYKPDFDWSFWDDKNQSPIQPNPIFCGLLQTTHVMMNPLVDQELNENNDEATRVVQMFVFRNTSGDIRIVRLYSELVGLEGGEERPWLKNPNPQDAQFYTRPELRVHEYIEENLATTPGFVWPPVDLEVLQHTTEEVTYAREDFVVPYSEVRFWRAHEWHHIAVSWDDSGGSAKEVPIDFIQVFVDGKPVSLTQKINYWMRGSVDSFTEGAGEFVRLNHFPLQDGGDSDKIAKDSLWVGCIRRPQMTQGGVFKFDRVVTFGANGTIDDVRTYRESVGERVEVARPADRFVNGVYEQRFEVPFPGGVERIRLGTLSFTAYLPVEYNDADPDKIRGARVQITVLRNNKPLQGFGGRGREFNDRILTGGWPLTHNLQPTGKPEYIKKGDTLSYQVRMVPGRNSLGNVATPVVDDVTLTYFLPKVAVLVQEEVLD